MGAVGLMLLFARAGGLFPLGPGFLLPRESLDASAGGVGVGIIAERKLYVSVSFGVVSGGCAL